jgi:hypothetical protein
MKISSAFIILATFWALACMAPESRVDVGGRYVGTITTVGTDGSTSRLILTLSQDANRVTGSWTTTAISGHFSSSSPSGTVTGSITGNTVNLTLLVTTPCTGTFTGSADAYSGGAQLSGSLSGSMCDAASERAFIVERE